MRGLRAQVWGESDVAENQSSWRARDVEDPHLEDIHLKVYFLKVCFKDTSWSPHDH